MVAEERQITKPRPRDTFTADSMVYYPPMISLSFCKPMCFAALLAGVVACAPNHQAAEVGGTTAGGGAATATTGQPVEQLTARAAAEKIKAAIPEVSLITITGDNDANNMIGRSTGYVAATVIVDPRTGEECDQAKPGIVCGAGIEQWPDAKAAQQRADYLKGVMNAMPILGTEYATLRGNLLLRVDGKLSPSVADQYKTAFTN